MEHPIRPRKRLWITLVVAGLWCVFPGRVEAGYKTVVGGITVSYSKDGAEAYYDPDDDTLTIAISENDGSLKIVAGADAAANWGSYVDVYLLADGASLKSISIKGSPTCTPYIAGQVGYVSKFTLLGGVVGNTNFYGLDFGLGMVSSSLPVSVSMKFSYTTAQLFGYAY